MALITPHEDAIDKALVNALHAFCNTTGKSKDDHPCNTERSYQGPSTSSMSSPLVPTQTLQTIDLKVVIPHVSKVNANADLCSGLRYIDPGHFSLIDTRSAYTISSRPPCRYATLIAMAILQADGHCLLLAQIYQWISVHFPFYDLAESGWQNSIRHNLSLSTNFIKIKRPSHYPGKGHHWGIKPGREHQLRYSELAAKSSVMTGLDWHIIAVLTTRWINLSTMNSTG